MHKKLASDLTSLAHSILQMKNKEDVAALKEKAYEVYEKLALLAYVEEYINTTPHAEETKEELIPIRLHLHLGLYAWILQIFDYY